MTNPVVVVITGGPHAGKTTIIERLKVDFASKASFGAESATILLSGGYPPPPNSEAARKLWLADFQNVVAALQIQIEKIVLAEAQQKVHKLVILDRSLGDLPAYHPKGVEAVLRQLENFGITSLHNRYHHIMHLHSLATLRVGMYSLEGNQHRYEDKHQAISIDQRIYRANHRLATSGFHDIWPRANFEHKYLEVKNTVLQILARHHD